MDLAVKNQVETSKEYIPVIKMLQKGKTPH